ncbi:hypothetical protein [uncultured Mediterranean phage uvMED]|nr:hypothetical protein [uncultured Mediterranean phage uvMED]
MVTPSSTAARMGVVDVYSPNVSEMFGAVSDTINTLAENQVKVLDAKWQNNFETETTKYLNNKLDGILKSGEKPDLEKFQEEADGYINGVLTGVPERLSINAESYYNQKNISAFETLRKQANIIEYKELTESYENNLQTSLSDIDNFIQNLSTTTQSPQEFIDSLDQYYATEVTKFLGTNGEKFNALIIGSNFKLNDSDKRKSDEGLMLSVEQKRVNGIVKSFFQNIDPNDTDQIVKAETEAQLFLRNYSLDQGGVRGVNYEIFADETGNTIGQEIIDQIVKSGIGELNTAKSLNLDASANSKASNKIAQSKLYNETSKNIKNLTNGFSLINEDGGLMNADEILDVYGVSATQAIKLETLNNSKIKVIDMLREAKTTDKPLYQLLENSSYADAVSDLGGQDEIIRQYYEVDLGLSDDIESYQTDINDINLQTMLTEVYKNQVAPPGFIAFLNTSTNEPFIKESNINDVSESLFNAYRTWNVATDGGTVDIKNLPANVSKIMKDINLQQKLGNSFNEISLNIKKNFDLTGSEKSSLTRRTNSYLEKNPIDVGNMIYQVYQSQSDNYKKVILGDREIIGNEDSTVDGYAPMLPNSWFQTWLATPLGDYPGVGVGVDPLTLVNKGLNKLAAAQYGDEFEDVFRRYHDLQFRNSVSFGDTDEALEKKSFAAGLEAMKKMSADGYGYSSFMSPDGEGSFQKYALESVASMDERNLRNTAAGYILGQIMNYENAGDTDTLINYGFVDFDGKYLRPTSKEILEMLEDGKFYFTWNDEEPVSIDGEPKSSNVRFDLFYNNYEDLKGRAANINSTPQFQFNKNDYFDPNYYNNDVDINSIKSEFINDAGKLVSEDSVIGKFVTEKSTAALGLIYDFATKIKPGDRKNIFDKKMVDEIAELESNYNFKIGKDIRNKLSSFAYETDTDKMKLFNDHYRNMNIAKDGFVPPIPFDVDKAQTIINEVDSTFEQLDGFTKTIISELLYSNDIDKNDLFKAIKKRNYKKIIKLVGQQQGELIQGMLYSPSNN